jgi:hypothetical protein
VASLSAASVFPAIASASSMSGSRGCVGALIINSRESDPHYAKLRILSFDRNQTSTTSFAPMVAAGAVRTRQMRTEIGVDHEHMVRHGSTEASKSNFPVPVLQTFCVTRVKMKSAKVCYGATFFVF